MKIRDLPLTITRLYAEPSPKRKLEINCSVSNPTSFDICILDAWLIVKFNGITIAEGRLFQSMHNRVDPAITPAGKQSLGAIHIDLPQNVMYYIEEKRAGGDVKLLISSRVLVAEVSKLNDTTTLQPPYETQFGNSYQGDYEYAISQSEWIKLLKSLSWSEIEILEIPKSNLRSLPSLARAFERFEDAQQNYRNGNWEETMMNCRKVFEAMVKDVGGKSDMKNTRQSLVFLIGDGEKTNRIDDMIKSLGNFLHLGRHENLPYISIKRADAELALLSTGALLAYLGKGKETHAS